MDSIRIRFTRGNEVKFISHLDLMKVFERALRRTGLPIAYSQGFNPHPQMVFGLPLSVGVTSEAEYADFELESGTGPGEFRERLNSELPAGIIITDARTKTTRDNIMASITGAIYEITIYLNNVLSIAEAEEEKKRFMQHQEIVVRKEGKGGSKDVDIKPMIRSLDIKPVEKIPDGYQGFASAFLLTACLKAGSVSNLKPELLVNALRDGTALEIGTAVIHRKELYVDLGGKWADPMTEAV